MATARPPGCRSRSGRAGSLLAEIAKLEGLRGLALPLDLLRSIHSDQAKRFRRRAAIHPDADLIRVCAEHVVNLHAYNAGSGNLAYDDDPLWLVYESTRDFIHANKPKTLAGMQAGYDAD
jgi:hypothetical protein